jgi:hypothetical protein
MHFTFKLRDQLEGNCPSTYNKGGGGGTTTTVQESGLPEEFRPYIEGGLRTAESMYQTAKEGVSAVMGSEDAPYRGLDRFFGYLGSGALGQSSTSTQTQSGGGK